MKTKHIMIFYLWFFLVIATGCTASDGQPASGSDDGKVFITDRTGRKWDITHAVKTYKMEPRYFNFGIGVGAIPSVDSPVVVEKDSQEYPDSDDNLSVFGVSHNGEQRAYSVWQMARHEVFNEEYPGEAEAHVSVAY